MNNQFGNNQFGNPYGNYDTIGNEGTQNWQMQNNQSAIQSIKEELVLPGYSGSPEDLGFPDVAPKGSSQSVSSSQGSQPRYEPAEEQLGRDPGMCVKSERLDHFNNQYNDVVAADHFHAPRELPHAYPPYRQRPVDSVPTEQMLVPAPEEPISEVKEPLAIMPTEPGTSGVVARPGEFTVKISNAPVVDNDQPSPELLLISQGSESNMKYYEGAQGHILCVQPNIPVTFELSHANLANFRAVQFSLSFEAGSATETLSMELKKGKRCNCGTNAEGFMKIQTENDTEQSKT